MLLVKECHGGSSESNGGGTLPKCIVGNRLDRLRIREKAALLVDLELEMRRGRRHALDGAELFGYKKRHLTEILAIDNDGEVVATAHQVATADLVKFRNAARDPVETTLALRRQFDLDESRDIVVARLFLIDHRMVPENRAIVLVGANLITDFAFAAAVSTAMSPTGGASLVLDR